MSKNVLKANYFIYLVYAQAINTTTSSQNDFDFKCRHLSINSHGPTDRFIDVPQTSASNVVEAESDERLRRNLAFFFMDPVRKFVARRQTPWKLMIQFLKIVLVTFQLVVFGSFRYEHTNYYADNEIGFKHLFLKVGNCSKRSIQLNQTFRLNM